MMSQVNETETYDQLINALGGSKPKLKKTLRALSDQQLNRVLSLVTDSIKDIQEEREIKAQAKKEFLNHVMEFGASKNLTTKEMTEILSNQS